MGDLSAEPSMEDILSSIKRIIAEDGDAPPARSRRSSARAPAPAAEPADADDDEILELSDPMPPAPKPFPPRRTEAVSDSVPASRVTRPEAPEPSRDAVEDAADNQDIMSDHTAQAARGALESLSRMLVKPEPSGDGTLEGLVREMLRPMLREWLDANLPSVVEAMVAREISKITGQLR